LTNPTFSTGAAPAGATDAQSAAAAVQSMFNTIAPRYDLLNHILSANIDSGGTAPRAASARHSTIPTHPFSTSAAAPAT
jgi:hypothetical protein